ncbi:TonB-dependent receptor [Flavihumibacter profundi]|uniref:TonB-dependent receptor n=1 Tax=Flavihumibacter profundi TaxID=2716883 RepID=UPI001CC5E4DC|nr:TonB-dependent receptor [Flavihumibacter profundi]MBZ5859353.1 TonB-dependent receptor [Flavihumibacter profundi]
MNQRKIFVFIFLGILFCLKSFGQSDTSFPVTAEFKNIPAREFISQLEKQTGFHFYFDTAQLDSVIINITANHQPLRKVLDQAFAGTDLKYAIDDQGHIFITKGQALNLVLPRDFFITGRKDKNKPQQPGIIDTTGKEEMGPGQIAGLENKLYVVGDKSVNNTQTVVTIAGYVRDAKTGEAIAGASVYIEKPKIGITTDQYGYYSLSLPKGRHILNIQSIGMKDTRRQIAIYSDGKMNIDLQGTVMSLKGVVISAEKRSNVKSTQMGLLKMDIKAIKQVPVVFGEADILRAVTTLPGVKTVGEASTGLNVRGGSADQNLILFNEGTIYNPSHFFGMFSAFNPEVVKDVELFKSSIPARYGGRLSSVLAVNSREGNNKKFTGSAGLGLLTSRLNIEGPLVKDKSSFIIGGRTTYANWLLNLLPDQYKNSKASFYDVNLSITHEFNKKNTLYLSGYISNDRFNLNSDTLYGYGNKNVSVKLKHIFNNKLNSVISVGYDNYAYNISSKKVPETANELGFDINQAYLKAHFNYYFSNKHTIDFGINSIYYKLHPGSYLPIGKSSLLVPDEIPAEQALESGVYVSDHYSITRSFALDGGLRYSLFNYLGPQTVNTYAPGLPRTESNMISTVSYPKGEIIKTYGAPEYRVSLRYAFNDSFSIKAGYNTQQQYIHSLSNTAAMAPTDIWKLSDANIKPQHGNQISLGIYKNFKSNTIETSVEVYYKNMYNYLDYKSGAELVMNHHIETDVFGTRGKAYGVEVLVKKLSGKLNGWISYTWSRVFLKMDDPLAGETINNGMWYPSNYDKPHDITLIGNYRFSHRFSISLNATYSTGRPITLPMGVFYFGGSYRTLYADRNAYRIPDYFRTDFSMNIEGNHKLYQKTHNSWTIGVYNLTGRKNAYSVYYVSENGNINGYKLSIFGNAIPYVNFNIRF